MALKLFSENSSANSLKIRILSLTFQTINDCNKYLLCHEELYKKKMKMFSLSRFPFVIIDIQLSH